MTKELKKRLEWWGLNLANVGICFLILAPIILLALGSLKTERMLINSPFSLLPENLTLFNYKTIFGIGAQETTIPQMVQKFPLAFMNSFIIAFSTALACIVFGVLTAYSITRLEFPGQSFYTNSILLTRLVPVIALLIPLFLLLRKLGLLNSLTGVIITEISLLLPYTIWILRGFFNTLPSSLEDAARIDGCSKLGTLVRIILPLSAPGIASCAVIVFLLSWNTLIIPLVVLSDPNLATIPVALASLTTDIRVYSNTFSLINAMSLVGLAPTAVLALLLRRYVVKGLTSGAVKG